MEPTYKLVSRIMGNAAKKQAKNMSNTVEEYNTTEAVLSPRFALQKKVKNFFPEQSS